MYTEEDLHEKHMLKEDTYVPRMSDNLLAKLHKRKIKIYIQCVHYLITYQQAITAYNRDINKGLYVLRSFIPVLYSEIYRNER